MAVLEQVPKLRFPEFSGEWETKKLREVAKITSGGTPNRSKPNYWNGNIPWITTSLIDFTDITCSNEFITEEGLNNSSAKLFSIGTILMAMYGQGKTRGRVAILDIEASTNQACAAIISKKNINNKFLFQFLVGNYESIRNLSNEGGQKNLSGGLLKSLNISFPINLDEQKKIASFLTSVDKKIELLQEKAALLEEYKKGVMQHIFSQQIRFKPDLSGVEGDDDGNEYPDWEEKRLGNILTIGSGRDYKHLEEGDIPVYGTGGLMCYVNDFLFDGASVGIGRKGTIDKPIFLKGKFWTVDTLFYTHSFNECLPKFVYYLFLTINWYRYNEASGVPSLSKATIEKIIVSIPNKKEQTKIADLLSNIDDKIELVNSQLHNTQNFKKGLLQQMFV